MVKKFKSLRPNLGASCLNHDRPKRFLAGDKICAVAALCAFLPGLASLPAAAAVPSVPLETQLKALRDYDILLGSLALRLTTANAALCTELMPGTGAVLHASNQYPATIAGPVKAVFGFSGPLAIEGVAPDSPAARAGLIANDTLLGVGVGAGSLTPLAPDGDGKPDTLVRDAFEDQLVLLPTQARQLWRVRRSGTELTISLAPIPACRARFEIVAGNSLTARNDGRLIQLSARYFARYGADELAVVVAHELAHTVLAHRRRLAAAGVSKGLLAEFGRSGRLNRQVEREADRLSVHLLRNAGYDPGLAPLFWDRFGTALGGGGAHDSPRKRAQLMRAEIAAIPVGAPVPYLPPLLALRDQPLK